MVGFRNLLCKVRLLLHWSGQQLTRWGSQQGCIYQRQKMKMRFKKPSERTEKRAGEIKNLGSLRFYNWRILTSSELFKQKLGSNLPFACQVKFCECLSQLSQNLIFSLFGQYFGRLLKQSYIAVTISNLHVACTSRVDHSNGRPWSRRSCASSKRSTRCEHCGGICAASMMGRVGMLKSFQELSLEYGRISQPQES